MNKFLNYYNSLCIGANTPAIFSNDPYIAAIKELLVHELQQVVYYIEKLKEFNIDMKLYTGKVIEFISILIVNMDFRKESFFVITDDLYSNKKTLKNMYISECEKRNTKYELLNELDLSTKDNILKALNDKQLLTKNKEISDINKNQKILYEIIINLVLNSCNCLIELKNHNEDFEEAKNQVLKLLNSSNFPQKSEETLVNTIKDFSKCNYIIMKKLYEATINKFGPVFKNQVEIGEKKGKAILVSGTSLIDLEKILQAVKDTDIKVYTHHEMINAFKYKKFSEFKNLVCHYRKSDNNFPMDFASFPGPIFISNNIIPQIDVIRGQIYTSAKYPAFGIGKIENDNFEPLVKYAKNTKGFEKNEAKETLNIGYNIDNIKKKITEITEKFKNKIVDKLLIIGETENSDRANNYIETFINNKPKNSYVIVFSDTKYKTAEKIYTVNSYYDFAVLYKIIEELKNNNPQIIENTSVFITDCNGNTISHIFNLIYLQIKNIFLGECCPNIINPALIERFEELFNINHLSTAEKDLAKIE